MPVIKAITRVEPNAFQGLDKSWIETDDGNRGYTFMRVTEGASVDGFWKPDKKGEMMLKKNQDGSAYIAPSGSFSKPAQTSFTADPIKSASIEKQTALKAAVEFCVGNRDKVSTLGAKDVTSAATEFLDWLQGKEAKGDVILTDIDMDEL